MNRTIPSEAELKEILVKRWAKRIGINELTLHKIISAATSSVYQNKPYTTVIVTAYVNGHKLEVPGFAKYNLNDSKLSGRYQWNAEDGAFRAMDRAYKALIHMVPTALAKTVVTAEVSDAPTPKRRGRPRKTVSAPVDITTAPRKRGRPRKVVATVEIPATKRRGRPRKVVNLM